MLDTIESQDAYQYENWSGTVSMSPAKYFTPKTSEEIQKILQTAREERIGVRVVGNQNTSNPLPCTSGFLINLKHFNKVLEVDKSKHTIKVGAGMVLTDLNEILAEEGLSLSVQAAISFITVGGAISTSVHGSGETFGLISTYVISMEMMNASGDIMEISKDSDDDLFQAAVLSLGCLGIILSVTLQCEPAFKLHAYKKILSDEDLENIDQVINESEHASLSWFPDSRIYMAIHASRTEKDIKIPEPSRMGGFIRNSLEYIYWICSFLQFLTPMANRFYYKYMFGTPLDVVARSDHVFNFDVLFQCNPNEWFIPRVHCHEAIKEMEKLIKGMSEKIQIPLVVRFVAEDQILLSPAYDRDSAVFQVLNYKPFGRKVPCAEFWEGFENIMKSFDGRPHWAKSYSPLTEDYYKAVYPKWNTFKEIRRKMDPSGLFLNPYLKDIFNE